MIDLIEFKRVKSRVIDNLHVAFVNMVPVGMVHKPRDSRTDRNYWRAYVGVGDDARFLGHYRVRRDAENHVRWAHYAQNATVVVVENKSGLSVF